MCAAQCYIFIILNIVEHFLHSEIRIFAVKLSLETIYAQTWKNNTVASIQTLD